MKRLMTIAREWRLVAAGLIAGAIVHIVATLHGAQIGHLSAFATLSAPLPVNAVAFAPPIAPENHPLPFLPPDSLYAFCRFDASMARVRVSVQLPEAGWSLSLFGPGGENFYYVPGSDVQMTDVQLTLVPPGNVFVDAAATMPESGPVVPEVRLPDAHGIAVLRAPIRGLAYQRRTDEARGTFKCQAMR